MKEKWTELIEQFKDNGYKPHDIQRIVMFYEQTIENDRLLKKMYEEENDESV